MTRKTQISLLTALALIAIAPNARAEIASKDYVDTGLAGKMNTMTVETAPTANSTNLVTSGGVAAAIASAVSNVDLSTKQDKLGGGNDAGKVVVAGETAGTVSYTGMQDYVEPESNDLVTASAVYGFAEETLGYALARMLQPSDSVLVTSLDGTVQAKAGLGNTDISRNAGIEMGKIAFPTPPTACSTQGCMLMFYNDQYVWEPVMRDSGETISTTGAVQKAAQYGGNGTVSGMNGTSADTQDYMETW